MFVVYELQVIDMEYLYYLKGLLEPSILDSFSAKIQLFISCIFLTVFKSFLLIYRIFINFNHILMVGACVQVSVSHTSRTYNFDSTFITYDPAHHLSMLNYLTPIQHLFIVLTVFLTPLALLSNWNDLKHKWYNIKSFLLLLIALVALLIICFSTFNLFLFIVMFESTTLPLFLLISLFGHRSKKHRAAWYLFIYTLLGSIFLLGSIILIFSQYRCVNLLEIYLNYKFEGLTFDRFKLIWLGLFLGFAIKVPIAPFHMWLPEAHVEAPTAVSILLAGILLKLGGFGIIFFLMPFFHCTYFIPFVQTITIISMLYSSFILFRETHLKKIIAYSSIIHMNIGILGLFTNNVVGMAGGIFMMFSHGFISAGLFFCAGIIFDRFKTYDITTIKNLSVSMPKFSFFLIILIFGNMGLPLTSGFVGEFLVLLGATKQSYFIIFAILLVLLLNTIYNIILMTRILYGNLMWPSMFWANTGNRQTYLDSRWIYRPVWELITVAQDITRIEFFALLLLSACTIFFGIYPNFLLLAFVKDPYLILM